MSMKTVLEQIVLVVFVIAVYVALPAGIIAGWIRWVRRRAPETRSLADSRGDSTVI
jgi:ABC-type nitrate/sulfonate/bicarbonate transport system permease component